MLTPRRGHLAILVQGNGAVIVAGGSVAGEATNQTEVFQPGDDVFVSAGPLTAPRKQLTGAALADGVVLAARGLNADGPNAACGVQQAGLRFLKSVYLNGETAMLTGSGLAANIPMDFHLFQQLPSSMPLQNLTAFGAATSDGSLPPKPIMQVAPADGKKGFLLTSIVAKRSASSPDGSRGKRL